MSLSSIEVVESKMVTFSFAEEETTAISTYLMGYHFQKYCIRELIASKSICRKLRHGNRVIFVRNDEAFCGAKDS